MLMVPRASESASKFCGGPPGAIRTAKQCTHNYKQYMLRTSIMGNLTGFVKTDQFITFALKYSKYSSTFMLGFL